MKRLSENRPVRKPHSKKNVMTKNAYLTIDDSPSPHTKALLSALTAMDVPALLYVRGDYLANDMDAIIYAIERGFAVANHNYSHRRASDLSYEECIAEITKTEKLIDEAYRRAGTQRTGKYFRFPHVDRGAGGWIVDYDAAGPHGDVLKSLFTDGLNITLSPPSEADIAKKQALQHFLKTEGFTVPFRGVTLPWYVQTEMAEAYDCLYTFSNSDWMLTQRHLARDWPYKTIDDLKRKIDDDPWLHDENSTHIILAHDQPEIQDVTLATVRHMTHKGFTFLSV